MMPNVLVIQTANDLPDERSEFLINDPLSRRTLPGPWAFGPGSACTIRLFRDRQTRAGTIGRLSERFDAMLREAGHVAMPGQVVGSSLLAAPKQGNHKGRKGQPPGWPDSGNVETQARETAAKGSGCAPDDQAPQG